MTNLILLIAILLIFSSYCIYTRLRLGMTDSISRTSIKLPHKAKGLFTLMSWMGFIFPFIDPWLIPAGFSLVAMGVTIKYDKYGETLHNVAALLTYVFAFLFLAIKFWWVGITYIVVMVAAFILMRYYWPKKVPVLDNLGHIVRFKKKWRFEIPNLTYWVEVAGFAIIWIGLLIHCV